MSNKEQIKQLVNSLRVDINNIRKCNEYRDYDTSNFIVAKMQGKIEIAQEIEMITLNQYSILQKIILGVR